MSGLTLFPLFPPPVAVAAVTRIKDPLTRAPRAQVLARDAQVRARARARLSAGARARPDSRHLDVDKFIVFNMFYLEI